jgi:type IV pilus assembly protein PilE
MKMRGFSLLEILICLGIAGIFACFAYPSYQHHIATSYRRQAALQLRQIANHLEAQYNLTQQYQNLDLSRYRNRGYRFTLQLQSDSYTLTGTPTTQQQQHSDCGTLSLNSSQQRSPTQHSCWR